MISFATEEDLKRYVNNEISKKLKEITSIRSATIRRKNRSWEAWEDTYLVDSYRFRSSVVMASVLCRTPSSVTQRMQLLRRMYGLPLKYNKNGKCYTFKL